MLLRDWLKEQPFTLTMSSGFFGFYAHAGMLSALLDEGFRPSKITGSSAGALVGATFASGTDIELIRDRLLSLSKEEFWDPAVGLGFLRGRKFRRILTELVSVQRVEDCKTPLALSAWNARTRSTRVFTEGNLVDVVYASCAVPFMFQPIWFDRQPYWDGGISDRPGLAGTSENERIFYHHIASKSPWRKTTSEALIVPSKPNMSSLVIQGLPRSGPDKIHLGEKIYRQARESCLAALDESLDSHQSVVIDKSAN